MVFDLLYSQIPDFNMENMTFPMAIQAAKSEFNRKNDEIASLERAVNQSEDEIGKLEAENSKLKDEITILSNELRQSEQQISNKNAIIVYLENYLAMMNFTIGNFCFSDALLKDPILFGMAMRDNPMSSFIFILPYTALLLVFATCVFVKLRQKRRQRRLRKFHLPLVNLGLNRPTSANQNQRAVYHSATLPTQAPPPPPRPASGLPAIPGTDQGHSKLAIDIPLQIERKNNEETAKAENLNASDSVKTV